MFKPAEKRQAKLRMTIDGPAGSGKTYTALRFAHAISARIGGKIAVIDTERGSASKYVGEAPDGTPWQFDVLELTQFSPERYTEAVLAAGRLGYSVLIIDSLSHAWEGVGGALEIKDRIAGSSNENFFTAWRHVTPLHNRMVDTILQAPMHVITTMRSRTEYVPEVTNGKITGIRRVGLAPVQRPGMEYEFDIVCDMDWAHIMTVAKSRCPLVADMQIEKPGPEFINIVLDWLEGKGSSVPVKPASRPQITLDQLLEQFDAIAIIEANGGKIPATQEEVESVFNILKDSK
ncbi:MAG: ATP-binding protein [Candidatus Methanomethylicaceae archaeon]